MQELASAGLRDTLAVAEAVKGLCVALDGDLDRLLGVWGFDVPDLDGGGGFEARDAPAGELGGGDFLRADMPVI